MKQKSLAQGTRLNKCILNTGADKNLQIKSFYLNQCNLKLLYPFHLEHNFGVFLDSSALTVLFEKILKIKQVSIFVFDNIRKLCLVHRELLLE